MKSLNRVILDPVFSLQKFVDLFYKLVYCIFINMIYIKVLKEVNIFLPDWFFIIPMVLSSYILFIARKQQKKQLEEELRNIANIRRRLDEGGSED